MTSSRLWQYLVGLAMLFVLERGEMGARQTGWGWSTSVGRRCGTWMLGWWETVLASLEKILFFFSTFPNEMKETKPYRSYLASQPGESQPKEWSLGLPACCLLFRLFWCSSSMGAVSWKLPRGCPSTHVETSLELLEHLLCSVMICVKTGITLLVFLFPSA